MKLLNDITPIEKDFGRWYTDVVKKGNLVNYGNTQGSIIFKPISFGIWENIQHEFNKVLKNKIGTSNVKLPLLINLKDILKEKEHIKGFAPELATITKVGDKVLDEPLVIRPTSEVLFTELFAQETNSYKDLPLLYNQWANVLRWEKKTSPFLRTREFMWHEGHTAHSNSYDARKLSKKVIKIYAKFMKDFLAIPTIIGKKTPKEKFAGAVTTYTIEAMMKDGKALQTGTSHYLGTHFSKVYNASFKNKHNEKEYVYQTSFGFSTRVIGAIIMSHGDNRGIVIPPKVATYQIDILELFGNKSKDVREASNFLIKKLSKNFRIRLDKSDKSPGFKAAQSEIEGSPLRIEVGPRDIANGDVTIVRRDTLEKITIKLFDVKSKVKELLNSIHNNLYERAAKRLEESYVEADTYEKMVQMVKEKKFVIAPFTGNKKDEEKIQNDTGITTRCIPTRFKNKGKGKCIVTGKTTGRYIIFAKAY